MSWKNLFFTTEETEVLENETEETAQPVAEKPTKSSSKKRAPEKVNFSGASATAGTQVEKKATVPTTVGAAKPNDQMAEHLAGVLQSKTSVPIGYMGFIETVNNLPEMPGVTEEARWAMAFGTLKTTQSLTKQSLQSSIDEDLRTLEEERKKFHEAMQAQLATKVDSERKEIEDLLARKADIQKELEKLSTELTGISEKVAQNEADIANAEAEISLKDQEFDATVNYITKGIHMSQEKINNFLPND